MVKLLPNIVKNYQKQKYDKLRVNLLTDFDKRYQKWFKPLTILVNQLSIVKSFLVTI